MQQETVSSICECGCGQIVSLAPRTDAVKGWVKGQPLRFVRGHSRREKLIVPGDRFGRLVVTADYVVGAERVPCLCDCGASTAPLLTNLPRGNTKSCGCLAREARTGQKVFPPAPRIEDRGYRTPCHIWQGTLNDMTGYGMLGTAYAHRKAYEASGLSIPAGWIVHHECEQVACVNPEHLTAVSRKEHARIHARIREAAMSGG